MEGLQFFTWLKDRFAERSTWDGSIIIAVSVGALIAAPFIKYIALFGLGYGAWRIYDKDQNKF
jgi:hypothetical protein